VRQGPMSGWRILAAEEELARRLLGSLNAAQKTQALIDVQAPEDIVTGWDPRVNIDSPVGLSVSGMRVDQEQSMKELVNQYIRV